MVKEFSFGEKYFQEEIFSHLVSQHIKNLVLLAHVLNFVSIPISFTHCLSQSDVVFDFSLSFVLFVFSS